MFEVSCWHKSTDPEFISILAKYTFLLEQQIKFVLILSIKIALRQIKGCWKEKHKSYHNTKLHKDFLLLPPNYEK